MHIAHHNEDTSAKYASLNQILTYWGLDVSFLFRIPIIWKEMYYISQVTEILNRKLIPQSNFDGSLFS